MSANNPFTIVLPCFNPSEHWAKNVIAHYNEILKETEASLSIVLVNDGSTNGVRDADIELLRNNIEHFQYIHYKQNCGKGHAVRKGVELAKTEIVVYTDIDFPYTTSSLISIYSALNKSDADVVIGVKDENYYDKVPAFRRVISKMLRKLIGWGFKIPITDTQCGLKGFNKKGAEVFSNTRIDRYLFDLEFILMATRAELRLKPIAVRLKGDTQFSNMSLRLILPELSNFLKLLFRLR